MAWPFFHVIVSFLSFAVVFIVLNVLLHVRLGAYKACAQFVLWIKPFPLSLAIGADIAVLAPSFQLEKPKYR